MPEGFADDPRFPRAAADAGHDFATFFAVSHDLMCIRDAEFRFLKVNQAWEVALGYPPAELEGRPMLDFIHPDDAPASRGHMQRIGVDGEVVGFVNRYRRRDGAWRSLEWRARRVGDLVYGVARDVTERLAHEAEMDQARAEAEAANRAKSDFLANMSHEIRTPLNGVIGVAAALNATELAAPQREMVELILNSGAMLERVVSDILDLSKIEAGRLEIEDRVFDLGAELGGVVEMFRLKAAEKGLAYAVAWGERARGEFVGDGVRLKQVLGNLVSNAIKFTATGEVRVRLDVHDGAADQPARFALEVADTGVGFDAQFAAELFQRFRQADGSITRRFGGTGLGLAICRALVEMMGGRIAAESQPGRGAVFRIDLPLARHGALADYDARRPAAQASVDTGASAEARGLQDVRILLAEDHPINQRVVELILCPLGVALTTVDDGAEAVAAYAGARFDLVLMDMQMPVMDGLAATRAIRTQEAEAARPRTPVIMLSANAMRQHRDDALAAGADLHLAKPVTAATLIEAVATVLEG